MPEYDPQTTDKRQIYRLLTGEHYLAFGGLDEQRARQLVLDGAPRLPHPRVPASVDAALRKALAKRPEDRYQSAAQMRDALEAAASGL